jgi:hypothetical protein
MGKANRRTSRDCRSRCGSGSEIPETDDAANARVPRMRIGLDAKRSTFCRTAAEGGATVFRKNSVHALKMMEILSLISLVLFPA